MRLFSLIIALGFFFPAQHVLAAESSPKRDSVGGKVVKSQLSLVTQSGETVKDNNYTFDFGTVHVMDPTQKLIDIDDMHALKHVLPGLKHDFILQNRTQKALIISSIEANETDECFRLIEINLLKNRTLLNTPYKLEPNAKVRVRVAFDYYNSRAGAQSIDIKVHGRNLKAPLANLTVKATVKTGIELSPDAATFGKVAAGQGASRDFTLTFDRRSPNRIPPTPLRILSSNPHVKIVAIPEKQVVNEVEINGDQILFPARQIPNFKADMVLNFRATLSPDAPVGPLNGEIRLLVVNMPGFLIVRDAFTPIVGKVVSASETK